MRFPTMWYVLPAKALISLHLSKCDIVGNYLLLLIYPIARLDIFMSHIFKWNHRDSFEYHFNLMLHSWADPEGGRVSRPRKKHNKYRVSSQYWSRTPEKPSQHSMLGHHQPASVQMAFRWRAHDVPLLVVFRPSLLHYLKKKTLSDLDSLWQNFLDLDVVCGYSARSRPVDQAVHTCSLIRAFASRLSVLWLLSYWLNTIWSF